MCLIFYEKLVNKGDNFRVSPAGWMSHCKSPEKNLWTPGVFPDDSSLFLSFNWTTGALQCCASFSCEQRESATRIQTSPLFWISFPLRSAGFLKIQSHSLFKKAYLWSTTFFSWAVRGFDPWVGKIHWRGQRLPSPLAWRIPWTV